MSRGEVPSTLSALVLSPLGFSLDMSQFVYLETTFGIGFQSDQFLFLCGTGCVSSSYLDACGAVCSYE